MQSLVVPQEITDPNLKRFLGDVVSVINLILTPQGPVTFFEVANAAALPTASDTYANTVAVVTSLGALAVCTNKTGSWAWTRADGSSI